MSQSDSPKTTTISFHLAPEDKREIRVEAAEQGMTISEYVRSQVLD